MTSTSTTMSEPRQVTSSEIAAYQENGWVKLERLISPAQAAVLLARAKEYMGENGEGGADSVGDAPSGPWNDRHDLVQTDEEFATVGLSKAMGRNVQLLMQRDIGVRMWANCLAVKIGTRQGSLGRDRSSDATWFHQDAAALPADRVGFVSFWIALDEVTEDMGALRFYSGSHKLGPLGRWPFGRTAEQPGRLVEAGLVDGGLVEHNPLLRGCPLSPPLDLRPGDATAHHLCTVHAAPQNTTDRPRWAFLLPYIPEDALYTGAPSYYGEDSEVGPEAVPNEPFGGPLHPKVYP